MLFEVKNLSVKLDEQPILKNISFPVEKGDIVAIIGPNGAGKTTLLRAILGIIPYQGEIIWHLSPKIGYVPQRFDFDHTYPLTVEELFLLKGRQSFWLPNKNQRLEVEKALSHTQVQALKNKKIGQLSAGQLQRVFIAYALYGQPDLLLFDEPTAGIDIGAEMTIYGLLKEVSQELNLTMLLVSHELNIVYQYASQVVCINQQLSCFGIPRQVLSPEQLQLLYGKHTSFYEHNHLSNHPRRGENDSA